MNLLRWPCVALVVSLLSVISPRAWSATEVVSLSTAREDGFSASTHGAVNRDGRFVAFASTSSNLASPSNSGFSDIYLRDRELGITTIISRPLNFTLNAGESRDPSISADGRFIAYSSTGENLVAGDTNALRDIFVYDRTTRTNRRVSVSSAGGQAQGGNSYFPRISGDGRFVAFASGATNLVPNDTNDAEDLFIHDLSNGTTQRVNLKPDGQQSAQNITMGNPPTWSHNGRWLSFSSSADDLVTGDNNSNSDVFLYDRQNKSLAIVSRTAAGTLGNGTSADPSLAGDGRSVCFGTNAANLHGVGGFHIVRKDLVSGAVQTVRPAATNSFSCSVSADGTRVALVASVGGGPEQVEVVDLSTGRIFAPARRPNGDAAGTSSRPALSADGKVVVFDALGNGIVSADNNFVADVFARPLADALGLADAALRVTEADGTAFVYVDRDGPLNGAVSVDYVISAAGDTAVPGVDYQPFTTTGTLSWAAGELIGKSINIPLIDTPTADGSRFLTVTLNNPTNGAILSRRTMQVAIRDTESDPVENHVGHGLKIASIVQRGTNWETGLFRAVFVIRNPSPNASFGGYLDLRFNGASIVEPFFPAFGPIPGGGTVVVDALGDVGDQPDGDLFAILYEMTDDGDIVQDSAYSAGFIDNGTQPPSGGTSAPNVGLKAPGFNAVTIKSVAINGPGNVTEGNTQAYTVTVTLSDNTTVTNAAPKWGASRFSINSAGVFSAGDVAADQPVTLSAKVTRGNSTLTGTRTITVKNFPRPPVITSPLTALGSTGRPFKYRITARHEPTRFSATDLPQGLQLNPKTGVISGVSSAEVSVAVTIGAENGLGSDTETLALSIFDPSPLTLNVSAGGSVRPDRNGQLLNVGQTYKLVARADPGQIFAGWSNGITSFASTLVFAMTPNLTLDATFVANPFPDRAGRYVGLITSETPSHAASGYLSAAVSKTGTCTGKLTLGGKPYPFKTALRADGSSPMITIPRKGSPPFTFFLELDVAGASGELNGGVESTLISSTIAGRRVETATAALAGAYTVLLPGPLELSQQGDTPDGSGYGVITISPKGAVSMLGLMGDGTNFAHSGAITVGNRWPFYAALYQGGGSVACESLFENQATTDFAGEALWFKPARPLDPSYPEGWPGGLIRDFLGSRYTVSPVVPGLGATDPDGNAEFTMIGGGLTGNLTQAVNVSNGGGIAPVVPLLAGFTGEFKASTGRYKGVFTDPFTGIAAKYSGVVQQKLGATEGLARGFANQVGRSVLRGK